MPYALFDKRKNEYVLWNGAIRVYDKIGYAKNSAYQHSLPPIFASLEEKKRLARERYDLHEVEIVVIDNVDWD